MEDFRCLDEIIADLQIDREDCDNAEIAAVYAAAIADLKAIALKCLGYEI